jgi:hypothetical protein
MRRYLILSNNSSASSLFPMNERHRRDLLVSEPATIRSLSLRSVFAAA